MKKKRQTTEGGHSKSVEGPCGDCRERQNLQANVQYANACSVSTRMQSAVRLLGGDGLIPRMIPPATTTTNISERGRAECLSDSEAAIKPAALASNCHFYSAETPQRRMARRTITCFAAKILPRCTRNKVSGSLWLGGKQGGSSP